MNAVMQIYLADDADAISFGVSFISDFEKGYTLVSIRRAVYFPEPFCGSSIAHRIYCPDRHLVYKLVEFGIFGVQDYCDLHTASFPAPTPYGQVSRRPGRLAKSLGFVVRSV